MNHDRDTILNLCYSIRHALDDMLPTTDALICLGLHTPAERLLAIREHVLFLTKEVIDMDRASLNDQLAHNASMAGNMLKLALELPNLRRPT